MSSNFLIASLFDTGIISTLFSLFFAVELVLGITKELTGVRKELRLLEISLTIKGCLQSGQNL